MSAGSAAPRLSDRQRLSWLRLIRTENVGPVSFRDLVNRFGSAEAALDALPDLARKGGLRRPPRVPPLAEAEAELERCERFGARFVAIGEKDYPSMLRRMSLPPPLVAIKGDAAVGARPAISIVGARNASASGRQLAGRFAARFGANDYVVVSGMARGIDAAAHEAALGTGTIAVLAGGLDEPYPPENLDLYARICAQGLAVSEMPFGWQPRARDFPRRNRLVAALGLGTLVVEAVRRSGSLITARLANEMGRSVFAVPGSPLDPRSEGGNALIRQGATLATSADDVMEALEPQLPPAPGGILREAGGDEPALSDAAVPDDDARAVLVSALGPTPTPVDELIHQCRLPASLVHMALLELDLAGRLERHAGGSVSLVALDA